MNAVSGSSVRIGSHCTSRCTGVAGMNAANGNTTSAANIPWIPPATTFSIATPAIGSGAITRSSISRVNPNSCTSGSATACTPWNMHAIATTPGTSRLEKVVSPEPEPPTPNPIFGNTYVNTKTKSSGCITERTMNSTTFLRRTLRSRIKSATNATVGVLWAVSGAAVVAEVIRGAPSR